MDLMKQKLEAMTTAFNLKFVEAFAGCETVYEAYAMVEGDVAHDSIVLPFFEAFSYMRKWEGDRKVKSLAAQTMRLVEDAYEETVGVPIRSLETDNWAIYGRAIASMAQNSKSLRDRLCNAALTGAGNWIDNKAFFAADRKYKSPDGKIVRTINNVTSSALSGTTLSTAYDTMISYAGHTGETLGVMPTLLLVGPKNRSVAKKLLENELVSDGTTTVSNDTRGLVQFKVDPRLIGDYADDWYLLSTGGAIKPVLLMMNKETGLITKKSEDDDQVFMKGQALFGCTSYGAATATFPHLAYRGGR